MASKTVTWNANGMVGKLLPIKHCLTVHKLYIMLINETRLKPQQVINLGPMGYNVIRHDRFDGLAFRHHRGLQPTHEQVQNG